MVLRRCASAKPADTRGRDGNGNHPMGPTRRARRSTECRDGASRYPDRPGRRGPFDYACQQGPDRGGVRAPGRASGALQDHLQGTRRRGVREGLVRLHRVGQREPVRHELPVKSPTNVPL